MILIGFLRRGGRSWGRNRPLMYMRLVGEGDVGIGLGSDVGRAAKR